MTDDHWPDPELVEIAKLTLDDELFARERLSEEVVVEYAERMQEGNVNFPPVRAIKAPSGPCWLVDGWHRTEAAKRLGKTHLYARIRPGRWVDAVLAAVASNVRHGLRRSNAYKRRVVAMLLDLPEWAEASDREVARRCGVSHPFVASMRVVTVTTPGNIDNTDNPPSDPAPEAASSAPEPAPFTPKPDEPAERPQQRERIVEKGHTAWPATPKPDAPVPIDDYRSIIAWLATAPDSERRRLADDAFSFIGSAEERVKHGDKVVEWLREHGIGDAWEPPPGDDAL